MDPVQPVAAASTVTATAAGGCAATEATDLQDPDALVCEILEMQMDMDCKGIDYSSSSCKARSSSWKSVLIEWSGDDFLQPMLQASVLEI